MFRIPTINIFFVGSAYFFFFLFLRFLFRHTVRAGFADHGKFNITCAKLVRPVSGYIANNTETIRKKIVLLLYLLFLLLNPVEITSTYFKKKKKSTRNRTKNPPRTLGVGVLVQSTRHETVDDCVLNEKKKIGSIRKHTNHSGSAMATGIL